MSAPLQPEAFVLPQTHTHTSRIQRCAQLLQLQGLMGTHAAQVRLLYFQHRGAAVHAASLLRQEYEPANLLVRLSSASRYHAFKSAST